MPSHRSQTASWTGPPIIRPLAVRLGSPSRTKYLPSVPSSLPHSWQLKHSSCHWPPTAVTTTSSNTGFLQPRHRGAVRREWHCKHHANPSFSTNGVSASKGCAHTLAIIPRESQGSGRKYITTFGAEEMADMPFCPASYNNFSFNRSFAALASWTEEFMEIKMTVES